MPLDRVDIDNICDYIPFVSTYTNIVDLIQKRRFEKNDSPEDPPPLKGRYVTHIENKSNIRCAILIIPVIGNAVIGLYDLLKAFVSFFEKEEEQKEFIIGRPTDFKHVGSGAAGRKEEEKKEEPEDLSAQIDAKIALYKEKEFEEERADLNAQEIYDNPPDLGMKLEHIPKAQQREYLKSLGFTEGFYANEDRFAEKLLGNLSRNMAPSDSIRKQLNDFSSETEYVKHLRELPVDKVRELILSNTEGNQRSAVFREKFLMFLLLDPRLIFDGFINENLSDLAKLMIVADPTLEGRLKPLIRERMPG